MSVLVTLREMQILECIKDEYKSHIKIATELNIRQRDLLQTIKYFLRVGYVEKIKMTFKAKNLDFVVQSKKEVLKVRSKFYKNEINEDDIIPYKPTEEEKEKINLISNKKLTRSQMAKMLNMSKASLLWSLCEIAKNNKEAEEERSGNFIFVDRLTLDIYKLISKKDYTIMQIYKELKFVSMNEIKKSIEILIQNEAIKVVNEHNFIVFCPLNKIVKLKS